MVGINPFGRGAQVRGAGRESQALGSERQSKEMPPAIQRVLHQLQNTATVRRKYELCIRPWNGDLKGKRPNWVARKVMSIWNRCKGTGRRARADYHQARDQLVGSLAVAVGPKKGSSFGQALEDLDSLNYSLMSQGYSKGDETRYLRGREAILDVLDTLPEEVKEDPEISGYVKLAERELDAAYGFLPRAVQEELRNDLGGDRILLTKEGHREPAAALVENAAAYIGNLEAGSRVLEESGDDELIAERYRDLADYALERHPMEGPMEDPVERLRAGLGLDEDFDLRSLNDSKAAQLVLRKGVPKSFDELFQVAGGKLYQWGLGKAKERLADEGFHAFEAYRRIRDDGEDGAVKEAAIRDFIKTYIEAGSDEELNIHDGVRRRVLNADGVENQLKQIEGALGALYQETIVNDLLRAEASKPLKG